MFDQLVNSWKFDFWLGLASLVAGLIVISPLLLSSRFRKRALDFDLEAIGLFALVVLVVSIGCYNYFGAGSGT